MSGTSLDGVDAAYLETDGRGHLVPGPALTLPYDDEFRARLRSVLGSTAPSAAILDIEQELTCRHAAAVAALRAQPGIGGVDLIGFHGQTIDHDPEHGRTWQIGDGALLARLAGVPVVADFRSADVRAGGQGAPLVPIYHRALCGTAELPVAILNIGGVANLTWIGVGEDDLIAFDTGPGNAPLDDWVTAHAGMPMDWDGGLAAVGTADAEFVARFAAHPYFGRRPPKSLDRNAFYCRPAGAAVADGAATIVECLAAAVAAGLGHLPVPPRRLFVTGGGRRNPAIMAALCRRTGLSVETVDGLGWDGDALEAQAFAYLAARSVRGLPLSFPGTTGVAAPLHGGVLHSPRRPSAAP